MHRLFRHFLAWLTCLIVFSATGTLNYFGTFIFGRNATDESFSPAPVPYFGAFIFGGQASDLRASLLFTGLTNVVFVAFLCLVVLMPVTVIADYLFTRKWSVSFLIQIFALIPILGVYLFPWSVFFGRLYWWFVLIGLLNCTLPVIVYWAIFKVTDRDYGN